MENHDLISYLIDKGSTDEFSIKNPLDELKSLLSKENKGISLKNVENCRYVTIQKLPISKITVGNKSHFEKVEARTPTSPTGSQSIIGVVILKNEKYKLLDGYHRIKYVKDMNQSEGVFVVISSSII